jgi:hypothetical protein
MMKSFRRARQRVSLFLGDSHGGEVHSRDRREIGGQPIDYRIGVIFL